MHIKQTPSQSSLINTQDILNLELSNLNYNLHWLNKNVIKRYMLLERTLEKVMYEFWLIHFQRGHKPYSKSRIAPAAHHLNTFTFRFLLLKLQTWSSKYPWMVFQNCMKELQWLQLLGLTGSLVRLYAKLSHWDPARLLWPYPKSTNAFITFATTPVCSSPL